MTADLPTSAQPSDCTGKPPHALERPPANDTLAVEAQGLVKTFGTNRAVDGIDLVVHEREIFGVLGPNGAGKTTMLQMLATLLPIEGGTASIFGYDVGRQPHAVRQLIGVTGQYASVDGLLTGRENLRLFGRLQGLSWKEARSIGDELLEQFDLIEAADRYVRHYSGGMRRRLDLAASLMTRPALIFLDEPTTGLDPRTRGRMWATIRALVADGCTILLTTQYLDEADQLADRIAVIDRGRKVAEGTSAELKAQVGGSSLRVQLDNGADAPLAMAVAGEVASRVPILFPAGNGFSVSLTDANLAADVLIALRQGGMDIVNAAIEQPTLDEVFMALTGRPGATSSPDPEANAA